MISAEIFNCSVKCSQVEFSSFQLGRTIEEGDKADSELNVSLYVELVEELRRETKSHGGPRTRQLQRYCWMTGMNY